MKQIRFEEEEMCVISCFDTSSREVAIQAVEFVIPFTRDDDELSALVLSSVEKLKMIPDEEFNQLDFESYRVDDDDEEAAEK
ncbi:MAG: hypothetical protein II038_07450 [Lachnospiraceae bacterium]|jgi:hypothetical protein|nr:hypothetical protein [Lachnospiraceae bacterium]